MSNPILRSEKHMTLPRIGSGGDVGFRPFLSPFPSVPLFSHAVIFLHFCAAHNFRLPTFNATFPHLFFTEEKMGTACQAYNFFSPTCCSEKSGTWKASQTVYAIQGYMQKVQIALAFCPTCFNLCDAQLLRERKHEKLFQTHSFYAVLPYPTRPMQTLSRKKLFSGAIPCFVDVQTRVSPYLRGK